jgi:hypothetical protein
MAGFTRVVHSIVSCRILLNLRRAAMRKDSSAVLTTLGFTAATGRQTNQIETNLHEVYGTRSDEEDPYQQADWISLRSRHRPFGEAERGFDGGADTHTLVRCCTKTVV